MDRRSLETSTSVAASVWQPYCLHCPVTVAELAPFRRTSIASLSDMIFRTIYIIISKYTTVYLIYNLNFEQPRLPPTHLRFQRA